MGLFGEQDASQVNADPFFIPEDIYRSVLTDMTLRQTQAGGYGLSMNWTVDDEDSEYYQTGISDWINIYFHDEDAKDSATLRRARATLKQRLTEIGLSEAQMNELVDDSGDEPVLNDDIVDEFIGTVRLVQVVNSRDKNDPEKVYTNIRKISALSED